MPEGIEEILVSNSAYIEQMMLYNNQSSYTVAVIYPCCESLLLSLCRRGLSSKIEDGQRAALQFIHQKSKNTELMHMRGSSQLSGFHRLLPSSGKDSPRKTAGVPSGSAR